MICCESCQAVVPDVAAAIDAGWCLYMDQTAVCDQCEHDWFARLDELCAAPADVDLADVPRVVERRKP